MYTCFFLISCNSKMTKKNYQIVGTVNRKIEKRGKIDTSNTQIHDRSLSCLRIDTYAYIVTHRLLLWDQIGDIKTPRMLEDSTILI